MKLKAVLFLAVMTISSAAEAKNAGWQCWCANSGPSNWVIGPNTANETDSLDILSQLGGGTSCACRNAATGAIDEIGTVSPGGLNP